MSNKPQCFDTATITKKDREALKALQNGEADEYQQKLVLSVIVKKIARTHDVVFIPGAADQSSFLSGRAFVGQQIIKYLNQPVDEA